MWLDKYFCKCNKSVRTQIGRIHRYNYQYDYIYLKIKLVIQLLLPLFKKNSKDIEIFFISFEFQINVLITSSSNLLGFVITLNCT